MQTDGQEDGRTDRMQAVVTCSLRLVFSPPVSQTLPPSILLWCSTVPYLLTVTPRLQIGHCSRLILDADEMPSPACRLQFCPKLRQLSSAQLPRAVPKSPPGG